MTSTIKVNNIQNQCGANIINESSNTITIGASGDTVSLASGASQTGFGRTGTVDWQTGSIKTATFTATNGEGYFCNTTGGSFTVNLPAGSAGAIVSIQDYNNTFDSNSLTVDANGSEKINGGDGGQPVTLSTEGLGITFVYIDSTVGWRSVQSNEYATAGVTPTYISATGGNTILTVGDFKTHVFTGPGTFTVCSVGNSAGSNTVDYFVVAAGGGSGADGGAGAGAGGFRYSNSLGLPAPLNSPLANSTGLPVSAQGYPIAIGSGGTGAPGGNAPSGIGTQGGSSTFSTITSAGGGFGGNYNGGNTPSYPGGSGGSGGGATRSVPGGSSPSPGGAGNTPATDPPQGQPGGGMNFPAGPSTSAGGGGAGAAAAFITGDTPSQCDGGIGSFIDNNFIGPTAPSYGEAGPVSNTRYFAGGGAGGGNHCASPSATSGGIGGGGDGNTSGSPGNPGSAGVANTGGGAGAGGNDDSGKTGGSGIVMIRYKFQN